MPTKKQNNKQETTDDLLRSLRNLIQDQTIIQLRLAGLPQRQIREIVGGDINRISRIIKHLKKIGEDNAKT